MLFAASMAPLTIATALGTGVKRLGCRQLTSKAESAQRAVVIKYVPASDEIDEKMVGHSVVKNRPIAPLSCKRAHH